MNQALHQFNAAPLTSVWLRNGFSERSVRGRLVVKYERLMELADSLLKAVVSKPARLEGKEIAYLRRYLDFSQEQCAVLMDVTEQTVSLWERGSHQITGSADTVLRRCCIEKNDFLRQQLGDTPITELAKLSRGRATCMYEGELLADKWIFTCSLMRQHHTSTSIEAAGLSVIEGAGRAPPSTLLPSQWYVGCAPAFNVDVSAFHLILPGEPLAIATSQHALSQTPTAWVSLTSQEAVFEHATAQETAFVASMFVVKSDVPPGDDTREPTPRQLPQKRSVTDAKDPQGGQSCQVH